MKRYAYVTTYIVKALDEAVGDEVVEKVESVLRQDTAVVGRWTKLECIEDVPDEDDE